MAEINKSDVLIVGAGVSGSYLGYLLASNGIDVIIIEKSKKIKMDSGIVSNKIKDFIKLEDNIIRQKIRRMVFDFEASRFEIKSKRPFAIILDKETFGRKLRSMALKSKVRIFYDEACKIKIKNSKVEVFGINNLYEGKILVGADGVNSITRDSLGIKRPKVYLGCIWKYFNKLQERESREKNRDEIVVYHNKRYSKRFFGWSIKVSNELGLLTELKNCRKCIENFFSDLVINENKIKIQKYYYHLVPIGTTKSYGRRTLLVGDACGHVKPLTGGGIIYSLACSKIAYEIIMKFLSNENEKIIENYEMLWKKEIGREIWFQNKLRDIYEKLTQKEINKITSKMKDIYLDEIHYDNSISIVKKILLQTPSKNLLEILFLLFKYFFS